VNSYPLFHRNVRDNAPSPSGNVLRDLAVTGEFCMDASNMERTFYEFFAGGGMARAGLGTQWKCVFANDFDRKKGETYRKNWVTEN
jgi:hypothetical protein